MKEMQKIETNNLTSDWNGVFLCLIPCRRSSLATRPRSAMLLASHSSTTTLGGPIYAPRVKLNQHCKTSMEQQCSVGPHLIASVFKHFVISVWPHTRIRSPNALASGPAKCREHAKYQFRTWAPFHQRSWFCVPAQRVCVCPKWGAENQIKMNEFETEIQLQFGRFCFICFCYGKCRR